MSKKKFRDIWIIVADFEPDPWEWNERNFVAYDTQADAEKKKARLLLEYPDSYIYIDTVECLIDNTN